MAPTEKSPIPTEKRRCGTSTSSLLAMMINPGSVISQQSPSEKAPIQSLFRIAPYIFRQIP